MNAGLIANSNISNFGWFGLNCPTNYNVTATSTPDHDVWGPDGCVWGAQDWVNWHKAMIAAYGKDQADNRWATEYDKSSYGSKEIGYSTGNPDFKAYVIATGLDKKSTILSKVYKAETTLNNLGEPVRNIGTALNNATQAASAATNATTTIISWLPWIVLAALAFLAFMMWNEKKIAL